ncbi:hypothetical protein BKA58DRAFT_405581 [Alternaria rosae]|uniref:uncharacterized protein n=1 Tax=Alternaria rosae TaxID=1187941 RepID=UPI001E8E7294|nr:uncharacterized protein BKA58DRAFT_405581 [Alternaria rosae]KAH6861149.1 hypothetical protein BKA58DRAFT_405581 [Alternaria rosae]
MPDLATATICWGSAIGGDDARMVALHRWLASQITHRRMKCLSTTRRRYRANSHMLTAISSFRDYGFLVGDFFHLMKNLVGLVIYSRFAPVLACDNGQFRQFYAAGGWDIILQDPMHSNCAAEWTELQADLGRGLLPMALQFIGPKVADIAILGMQRPVLATLMSLGSSCPTLESDRSALETARSIGHAPEGVSDDILWPDKLNVAPLCAKALICGFEYILVGTAAANSVIQGWQLSFWAIYFISTLVGTYCNTAEGFFPLLLVFLPLPLQALGICVLYLGSEFEDQSPSQASSQHPLEVTPLAFSKNGMGRKKRDNLAKGTQYWMLILDWAIRLLVWVQVLYGTMVLSSNLFMSLFTALEVVGRFLAGAMACRVVLQFEMYGLLHKFYKELK